MIFIDVDSHIHNDNNTSWTVAKIYSINKTQANTIDSYTKSCKNKYVITSFNCTTYAVDAVSSAGIKAPTKSHIWTMPFGVSAIEFFSPALLCYGLSFQGYDPSDAGQDIRGGNYIEEKGGKVIKH